MKLDYFFLLFKYKIIEWNLRGIFQCWPLILVAPTRRKSAKTNFSLPIFEINKKFNMNNLNESISNLSLYILVTFQLLIFKYFIPNVTVLNNINLTFKLIHQLQSLLLPFNSFTIYFQLFSRMVSISWTNLQNENIVHYNAIFSWIAIKFSCRLNF